MNCTCEVFGTFKSAKYVGFVEIIRNSNRTDDQGTERFIGICMTKTKKNRASRLTTGF